jgi:acyl-[acyl-carrier-protein]-phospholipid O-acyltransferase/long-chain-fatty-acid--[acyl-carrier-protein] ligase
LRPAGGRLEDGLFQRLGKVGGEMVSLSAVEDALAGAFSQHGLRCQVAIIMRADAGKGERSSP